MCPTLLRTWVSRAGSSSSDHAPGARYGSDARRWRRATAARSTGVAMAESRQTARAVAWPRVNGRPAPFSFRIDEVSTKKKGAGRLGGGREGR